MDTNNIIKTEHKEHVKTKILKEKGFHLDVNDPRNKEVVQKIRKLLDTKTKGVSINQDFIIPYITIESLRLF
jgi:hypothetical protein